MHLEDNRDEPISVYIVEDREIHKEWLREFLAQYNYVTIVGISKSGKAGLVAIKQIKPKLIILDFQLPDVTGLEVAKRIKAYDDNIKVFMLSAHDNPAIVSRVVSNASIDAIGVKGSPYLEANMGVAIQQVVNGSSYIDPILLSSIRGAWQPSELNELSRREFEIFIQMKMDKSDQNIADDLSVELAHVRNTKSRISKVIKRLKFEELMSKLRRNAS